VTRKTPGLDVANGSSRDGIVIPDAPSGEGEVLLTSIDLASFEIYLEMNRELWLAAEAGNIQEMEGILRNNGKVAVNWRNHDGSSALFQARFYGQDAAVGLLLAHPDIDVNLKDKYGSTPFKVACSSGRTACVRLMLKDSRVMVNEHSSNGYSPLVWAASYGYLDLIRWWIASGREMDLGEAGNPLVDPILAARRSERPEVTELLERFKGDAARTRHVVRTQLGLVDELAAQIFALVVFFSDGLLQVNDTTPSPAARFFSISGQLPLEVQMVLCFRLVGPSRKSFTEMRARWPSGNCQRGSDPPFVP